MSIYVEWLPIRLLEIVTETALKTDFKPCYIVSSHGMTMIWFDYSVINLKYLLDSLAQIGSVRRLNLRLRVTFNVKDLSKQKQKQGSVN